MKLKIEIDYWVGHVILIVQPHPTHIDTEIISEDPPLLFRRAMDDKNYLFIKDFSTPIILFYKSEQSVSNIFVCPTMNRCYNIPHNGVSCKGCEKVTKFLDILRQRRKPDEVEIPL